MKKSILFLIISLAFVSCGSNTGDEMTYAEFKRLIMSDSVESITVHTDKIQASVVKRNDRKEQEKCMISIQSQQAFGDSLSNYIHQAEMKGITPRYSVAYVSNSGIGDLWIFSVVPMFFLIGGILLFLYAIIDILKSKFETDIVKLMWAVVVILAPFIGAILYICIGRKQKFQ